jgi:benzoyl-CoA reductase/2-hydroxyglutaryl-CoA dehydratase subunit BcrC/BadD/HgdB
MGELTTLQTLRAIARDPYATARAWKERGGTVIGYRCLYVPEEILWAAGALPHPLYGTPEPVSKADAYFQSCSCELVRNLFDHALAGDFDFLDGLAVANTCDVVRRLFDMWERYLSHIPVWIVNNPQRLESPGNKDYWLEELRRFQAWVQARTGSAITDDRLREAIALHDRRRTLLGDLWALRESDPPALKGSDALEVALAAAVLPVDRANVLLGDLLGELEARPPDAGAADAADGPRILVTGSLLDHPALIRMVEEVGGQVVAEDLCTTTRLFWHRIADAVGAPDVFNEDVPEDVDPLDAIWENLNRRPLCACFHPPDARHEFVLELADTFAVDAVLNFNLKYCHPFAYEAPLLTKTLAAEDLPFATLEVGHDQSGHGQLRTRIQAFVEMVES